MLIQRHVFRERALPLLLLAALLAGFAGWIFWVGRAASFRQLTGYHSPAADFFFRYFTHLGDGIFIVLLAVLLAVKRNFLLAGGIMGGYLLSGLFAQLGKRLLNLPRPKAWFEAMGETVYQVPGLQVHLNGSFPSGHTASAFALAVFLLMALPYRWYSWLLLLAACGVGFSRIYLSQHFPVDVCAGAIIGSISGILVYLWVGNSKILNSKFQNSRAV